MVHSPSLFLALSHCRPRPPPLYKSAATDGFEQELMSFVLHSQRTLQHHRPILHPPPRSIPLPTLPAHRRSYRPQTVVPGPHQRCQAKETCPRLLHPHPLYLLLLQQQQQFQFQIQQFTREKYGSSSWEGICAELVEAKW